MKRIGKILIVFTLLLGILAGCGSKDVATQRELNAGQGEEILIGVPVPLEFAKANTKFLNGLELALKDINSQGINGKKLKLEIVDDKGNFKDAVVVAQEFCDNVNMVAVIGHWFSDICLPVSDIYEEAKLLTLVPTVSNPELTDKGYNYIFQSITSDKRIAEEMAAYAKSQGYKKVVICYEDSSYGKNLADAIEREVEKNGLKTVDRTSGLVSAEQFSSAYAKWKSLDFDAVLLALNMPEGATYIRELRNLNKEVGIISADGLDVNSFISELGKDAEGVVIVTTYRPDNQRSELKEFIAKYQAEYNEEPDVWAIQGYEALSLIAHAIKESGSYSPTVLANYLREMEPWQAVSGTLSFNELGEIEGREMYKKVVANGSFQYIN